MKRQQILDRLADHDETPHAEFEVWQGRYSGKSMAGGWLTATIVSTLIIVAARFVPLFRSNQDSWYAAIWVMALLWIMMISYWIVRWLRGGFHLTSRQMSCQTDLLFGGKKTIDLLDIDGITLQQGPMQSILNVGNIKVSSNDASSPDLSFHGVSNVRLVAELIDLARDRERRLSGITNATQNG